MKAAVLERDGAALISRVEWAVTPWERMRGLLGREGLDRDRAMYMVCHGSVHTFFMKFSLDLVFLARDMKVTRIMRSVAPNRIAAGGRGAWSVIEMEAGWFPADALRAGDEVRLVAVSRRPSPCPRECS